MNNELNNIQMNNGQTDINQQNYNANNNVQGNVNNVKMQNNPEKKVLSLGTYFLHFCGSFIVWNIIFGLLFDFANSLNKEPYLFETKELIRYFSIFNVLWIISTILTILMTYFMNKKKTVVPEKYTVAQHISYFILLVGILLINYKLILQQIEYSTVVGIISLVVHLLIIVFLNGKMFNKYIKCKE